MTEVQIYKPRKNAMQSGRASTRRWVLEFEPEAAKTIDPLMGWSGSTDTRAQIRLTFPNKDDAVAYAVRNGLTYRVQEPKVPRVQAKSYARNFT